MSDFILQTSSYRLKPRVGLTVRNFKNTTLCLGSHAVIPNQSHSLSFLVKIQIPKQHMLEFITIKLITYRVNGLLHWNACHLNYRLLSTGTNALATFNKQLTKLGNGTHNLYLHETVKWLFQPHTFSKL
jgi:hypothetical protein